MKKSIFLCGLLALSTLFAESMENANVQKSSGPSVYNGGVVLGIAAPFIGGATMTAFQVGYYDSNMLFDIGTNFTTDVNSAFIRGIGRFHFSSDAIFLISHLGGRSHLFDNLFVSYGLMGADQYYWDESHANGWDIGVFAGLDYQISRHFMISGKIYPYNYSHASHAHSHNVFANGIVSLFYVF